MVEEEVRGAGVADELEQRDDRVGRPPRDELAGAEAVERGLQVLEALAEPPAGDAAREVGAVLLRRPDVGRHDLPGGARRGRQRRVVLHPEVPPEPDDALHPGGGGGVPAAHRRGRDRHGQSNPILFSDQGDVGRRNHGGTWLVARARIGLGSRDSREQWSCAALDWIGLGDSFGVLEASVLRARREPTGGRSWCKALFFFLLFFLCVTFWGYYLIMCFVWCCCGRRVLAVHFWSNGEGGREAVDIGIAWLGFI